MLNLILLQFQEGQLESTSLEATPGRTVTVSDHVTKIKEMKKVYSHVLSVLAGCFALFSYASVDQTMHGLRKKSKLSVWSRGYWREFVFEFPFLGNFIQ
jgi:hypothetical protein